MAFFCADEPLPFSASLPEQSPDAALSPPVAVVVPALLSLPHAVSVSPAIAVADTVVINALPIVLRFTCLAFLMSV
ncbi:hypothetical protein [Mycolicibacterium xanthum]|uniref:hypothetical protein n=1 Tax=Mycolicibacterium xanthum TaxID=2796469 RepID=UPI0021071CF3|nr:hypothetical protein [Mycolicibacterium xanthum]